VVLIYTVEPATICPAVRERCFEQIVNRFPPHWTALPPGTRVASRSSSSRTSTKLRRRTLGAALALRRA